MTGGWHVVEILRRFPMYPASNPTPTIARRGKIETHYQFHTPKAPHPPNAHLVTSRIGKEHCANHMGGWFSVNPRAPRLPPWIAAPFRTIDRPAADRDGPGIRRYPHMHSERRARPRRMHCRCGFAQNQYTFPPSLSYSNAVSTWDFRRKNSPSAVSAVGGRIRMCPFQTHIANSATAWLSSICPNTRTFARHPKPDPTYRKSVAPPICLCSQYHPENQITI